jgi:hypothetical protein
MAYDQNRDQGGFRERPPMLDVDEKCADCGTEIKQLPFKPDPARKSQLRCKDCYRQKRESFDGGRGNR